MLSRVLQESFFAHVSARAAPLSRITRKSLHPTPQFVAGRTPAVLFGHFRPVGTCLMRTPWDRPGLTGFQRQVFGACLYARSASDALCLTRADMVHRCPGCIACSRRRPVRRRRIRVSSLIMRISIITSIFNNNGYLHIIEYLH